jgi:hypothetical protein
MTHDGILVGEIAHIEAPVPGGPRFRASMTNEECRNAQNLLLMCGTHHTRVDRDLGRWTVEDLQQLKKKHEEIYSGAIDRLRSTVGDVTEHASWRPATNLGRILENDFTPDEQRVNLETVNAFAERLTRVPIGARSVLALVVTRGKPISGGRFEEVAIPMPVLEQLADCPTGELIDHLNVLEHFELAFIDVEPFEGPPLAVVGNSTEVGWPLLRDLHELDDKNLVRQALIELDFTALDV